ncbi:hypothetical protein BT69DRAFT_1330561 [Atractiella rhizophila]|nr:hypothetical protein BT69DRAFT_1330561 [Atractiella rhizophila]
MPEPATQHASPYTTKGCRPATLNDYVIESGTNILHSIERPTSPTPLFRATPGPTSSQQLIPPHQQPDLQLIQLSSSAEQSNEGSEYSDKNCKKSRPAKRKRSSYLDTDGEKDERNEDEGSEEMETEDGERLDSDVEITREEQGKEDASLKCLTSGGKEDDILFYCFSNSTSYFKHRSESGKKSVPQMCAEMDVSGPPLDASDVDGDEKMMRRKPKANPIWECWTHDPTTPAYPNGIRNNCSKYQCKLGYGTVYSFFGCEYSNLNKHTHTCKKHGKAEELGIKLPEQPPRMRNPDGDPNAFNSFSTLKKRTQEECDQLFHKIVEWILRTDKPWTMVEEDGFKELIGFLDETVKVYSTTTARTWASGLHSALKVQVQQEIDDKNLGLRGTDETEMVEEEEVELCTGNDQLSDIEESDWEDVLEGVEEEDEENGLKQRLFVKKSKWQTRNKLFKLCCIIRSTPNRHSEYKKVSQEIYHGHTNRGVMPKRNNTTRWNSEYNVLTRGFCLKQALHKFVCKFIDNYGRYTMKESEWKEVKVVATGLKVALQGDNSPPGKEDACLSEVLPTFERLRRTKVKLKNDPTMAVWHPAAEASIKKLDKYYNIMKDKWCYQLATGLAFFEEVYGQEFKDLVKGKVKMEYNRRAKTAGSRKDMSEEEDQRAWKELKGKGSDENGEEYGVLVDLPLREDLEDSLHEIDRFSAIKLKKDCDPLKWWKEFNWPILVREFQEAEVDTEPYKRKVFDPYQLLKLRNTRYEKYPRPQKLATLFKNVTGKEVTHNHNTMVDAYAAMVVTIDCIRNDEIFKMKSLSHAAWQFDDTQRAIGKRKRQEVRDEDEKLHNDSE